MPDGVCPHCGAILRPDATYCGWCGNAVTAQQNTESASGESWYYNQNYDTPKKTKTSRDFDGTMKAMSVCLRILLISLIAVLLFDMRQAFVKGDLSEALNPILSDTQQLQLIMSDSFPNRAAESAAEELFEDSLIMEYLPENVQDIMMELFKEVDLSGFSMNDFQQIAGEGSDTLLDIAGEEKDDTDLEQMLDQLEGTTSRNSGFNLSNSILSTVVYYCLKLSQSYGVFAVLGVLTLLPLLRLMARNKWDMIWTCGDLGATLMVEGGLMLLAAVSYMHLPDLWEKIFGRASQVVPLIGVVLTSGMILSAAIFVLGIIFVLIKLCFHRK